MKNLLLALAGALMLSASINAQTTYYVYMYEPDNYQNAKAYESQVVNVNGTTQNVQLTAYSGNGDFPETINMALDFSTGSIALPEVGTTITCEDIFTDWMYYVDELYYSTDDLFFQIYSDAETSLALAAPCYHECEVVECPEDLTSQLSACQASNAGLSDAVSAQGQQINDLQATIDSLEQANANLQFMFDNAQAATNECEDLVLDLNGIIAAQEDMLADCTDANQTLMDAYAEAQEVNAELVFDLEDCQDYTAWADWTISVLQSDAVTSGEIIDNLTSENEQLATDLYECQSDLTTSEGQLDNCQDNFANWQAFTAGVQADLLACENVNADLLDELAGLSSDLVSCNNSVDGLNGQIEDLYGVITFVQTELNDTIAFYNNVLIGAGTTINELNAEVEDLEEELADALAESDTCFQEYSALDDQFIAAVEQYEGIIDNLEAQLDDCETAGVAMLLELQNQLAECGEDLAAAQAAASACPAAIETAVANALAIAEEECNLAQMEVAAAQYQLGYDAATEECSEVELDLLNETYWNGFANGESAGYQAGLDDCEGEVSGLVDIDGTVINVIGYYNQLGQVIDPATATGVIIRKHEDGTFSKYFR
jgi:archaellum component FlaC